MDVALQPSDWLLGKVFSPGREGSGGSVHTDLLLVHRRGLRVYTTNSPIQKAEEDTLNCGLGHVS